MTKHTSGRPSHSRSSDRRDTYASPSRRFGHICLAHRPVGRETLEQYIVQLQERLDLGPWGCWQVAITQADRDRWKTQRYLTRQTVERSGQVSDQDEQAYHEIKRRRR